MKHLSLALLFAWLLPMAVEAQEVVPVAVQGQVTVHNKDNGKDIRERVEYTMLTKAEAQEAKAAFDRLTAEWVKLANQNFLQQKNFTIQFASCIICIMPGHNCIIQNRFSTFCFIAYNILFG